MGCWIVGAGAVGREVLDACLHAHVIVDGFVDDSVEDAVAGLPVRRRAPEGSTLLVAIGAPAARLEVVHRLGLVPPEGVASVVHPAATVGRGTEVAGGSVVLAGAVVSVDARLGPHSQVHYGATIGHDTVLGLCATVLPGAHVAGEVTLGEAATVGSGAVVLQGLEVGAGATVGAGAVVTRDVPPGATVTGIPARPV